MQFNLGCDDDSGCYLLPFETGLRSLMGRKAPIIETSGFKKSIGILAGSARRLRFAIAVFAFEASLDSTSRWFRLPSRRREWFRRGIKNLGDAIQAMLSITPLTSTLLARRAYLGLQTRAHLIDRPRRTGN